MQTGTQGYRLMMKSGMHLRQKMPTWNPSRNGNFGEGRVGFQKRGAGPVNLLALLRCQVAVCLLCQRKEQAQSFGSEACHNELLVPLLVSTFAASLQRSAHIQQEYTAIVSFQPQRWPSRTVIHM